MTIAAFCAFMQAQEGSAGTAGWYVLHSIYDIFVYSKLFAFLLYAEAPEDPMASMLAKIRSGGVQLKKVTAVSIPSCRIAYLI